MDQGPLVKDEIDAGAALVREFDKVEPVAVAFWLKASDDEHRYLYIAAHRINGANIDGAYGEILRLTTAMQSPWLDPFRVKLINVGHRLAEAALDIHRRFPGRTATRFGGTLFGGTSVDEVFIYPPMAAAAVP